MQTIVYQCDTAMPVQKLPNCCIINVNEFDFGSSYKYFISVQPILIYFNNI